MKFFAPLLASVTLALFLPVTGCIRVNTKPPVQAVYSSPTAIFVSQRDPSYRLYLLQDGTFFLYEQGMTVRGTFKITANTLALAGPDGIATGTIESEIYKDKDGELWSKEPIRLTPFSPAPGQAKS